MRREGVMEAAVHISKRAAELRRDFDRGFADPPSVRNEAKQDLLAIRLGARRLAIRLSEIAGLFADKKITPVPGAATSMLGIAGFRGSILPVYDLRSLLDLSTSEAPRWLVVAAAAPVAFSFEAFEEQIRVPADAIKREQTETKNSFTKEFIQTEGILRPIIQLSAVLEAVLIR
jgi:purine-binding chemotaxis protein CheW